VVTDLEWAVKRFQGSRRRKRYENAFRYYEGDHQMAFATDKFKATFFDIFKDFSENLCPAVIDPLTDRLRIVSFRSSTAVVTTEDIPLPPIPSMNGASPTGDLTRKRVSISDPDGELAWEHWERNRMDLKSTEVHRESLLTGDAYVIVWPDENMEPAIFPQIADECDVQYDPNSPGQLLRAAKVWYDDVEGLWRLNVYLRDHIEKYRTQPVRPEAFPTTDSAFIHILDVPNPYNIVPVFHFPNKVENNYGISELKDVIPIQDGLNKSVVDMLVAMEFAAYKQRYIIGYDPEINEETGEPVDPNARQYGVDRLMGIPDPEAKVGQFDATDLAQFLKVQDKFWLSAARVSGTPLHYFYITSGDFPSGEAIKSAEGRFIRRIEDQQTAKGNRWEDVIVFCMQIARQWREGLTFTALWDDATPRSDAEIADTAVKKRAVGVPDSTLQREMGYSEEEIEQNLQEAYAQKIIQSALKMSEQQRPEEPTPAREQTRGQQGVQG
jgi:hypothetical protein